VYEQCEEGATFAVLKRALENAGFLSKATTGLRDLLQSLLNAHLIIQIDDRYLGLAISGNYRLEKFAHHLAKGSQLPIDLKLAVQRLFDAHPDTFGHHLALYLT